MTTLTTPPTTLYVDKPAIFVSPIAKIGARESKKVTHRLYADGREAFVCNQCGYDTPKIRSTMAHTSTHRTSTKPRAGSKRSKAAEVDVLLDRLRQVIEPSDGSAVAMWKSRALTAERKLASMRKALGVTE